MELGLAEDSRYSGRMGDPWLASDNAVFRRESSGSQKVLRSGTNPPVGVRRLSAAME